jgi:hypothetical protein
MWSRFLSRSPSKHNDGISHYEKCPLEIKKLIVNELDIKTKLAFACVNKEGKEIIENLFSTRKKTYAEIQKKLTISRQSKEQIKKFKPHPLLGVMSTNTAGVRFTIAGDIIYLLIGFYLVDLYLQQSMDKKYSTPLALIFILIQIPVLHFLLRSFHGFTFHSINQNYKEAQAYQDNLDGCRDFFKNTR